MAYEFIEPRQLRQFSLPIAVLAWIKQHQTSDGSTRASMATIAADLNAQREAVNRAIRDLERRGMIGIDRVRESNIYRILGETGTSRGVEEVNVRQDAIRATIDRPREHEHTGIAGPGAPQNDRFGRVPQSPIMCVLRSAGAHTKNGVFHAPDRSAGAHGAGAGHGALALHSAGAPALTPKPGNGAPALTTANGVPPPHTPPLYVRSTNASCAQPARSTIEELSRALAVRAAAAGITAGDQADRRKAKELMRSRGISRRAFEAIAELVPSAFVRANARTVGESKSAAVLAAALWNDDAGWLQAQADKAAPMIVAKIDHAREVHRDQAAADAQARAKERRAKVAHLSVGEFNHAVLCRAETLDPKSRKVLLLRLDSCKSDPFSSPLLVDAVIDHLEGTLLEATA